MKNDVNVPSKRNKHENLEKFIFYFLMVTDENSKILNQIHTKISWIRNTAIRIWYKKKFPPLSSPPQTRNWRLAVLVFSKSTEEREEMDGDKENLLEGEIPPGMELPETFPFSLRNLDTDPFLRIQVRGILSSWILLVTCEIVSSTPWRRITDTYGWCNGQPVSLICRCLVRDASKIKLKNVNKKRMATARRLIFFWNFSRHRLLIWLHCCFHHYKTLKAVATAAAAIVVLTPANFYHFRRPWWFKL